MPVSSPASDTRVRLNARLERNRHLDQPSVGNALRFHGPHRVPTRIHLASLVRHLPVGPCAREVRHEDVSVGAIAKRVEQYLKVVLLILGKILLEIIDDDSVGLSVVEIRADVEILAVEQHADIRALGGRLSCVWLALGEVRRRNGLLPFRLVKAAVHDDGAPYRMRDNGSGGPWTPRVTRLGAQPDGSAEQQ